MLVAVGVRSACCMQMDVLAFRTQQNAAYHVDGSVLVNGVPPDLLQFRQSTAYVTQEDYLPVTETVRTTPPPVATRCLIKLKQDVSYLESSTMPPHGADVMPLHIVVWLIVRALVMAMFVDLQSQKTHITWHFVTPNHVIVRTRDASVRPQVRECLMFSAQLRLPSNMTTAEKSKRVDDVIEELVRPFSFAGHQMPRIVR